MRKIATPNVSIFTLKNVTSRTAFNLRHTLLNTVHYSTVLFSISFCLYRACFTHLISLNLSCFLCRTIRSDHRQVIPWKTSGYLITLLSCFSNSWRIQRNFKREMASSSARPRTLSFIFDQLKILGRSKSRATTTL